ncbi:MAG: ferrous iron transport protein B [Thermodesulfobacteriota bacterium]
MSERTVTVALAGNPNSGKTTLFNALTGARQHVGNWPGVTVEKKEGRLVHDGQEILVVDLPGTYSLTAYSLEEIIARNFIVDGKPDVVIDVVDASSLERHLYLAIQLVEMGVRVVLALNMIDVADGRRISIDQRKLSAFLGIPVVATVGKRNQGISELLSAALESAGAAPTTPRAKLVNYGTELEEEIDTIEAMLRQALPHDDHAYRWLAVKLLEGDQEVAKRLRAFLGDDGVLRQVERSRAHLTAVFDDTPDIITADARYGLVSGIMKQTVRTDTQERYHLSDKIDTVLTNRLVGPVILMAVLYFVYMFTFQGSEPLCAYLESLFKWLGGIATDKIPEGLLRSLVVSGLINGVGGILRFTPLIAFMFLAIAILEDTGYLARIAFMLDRLLRGFGLHGSAMLALMVAGGLAGGCAVPGVMATRTMREPKERLTTILVIPLMNCGAKLPVYGLLIGAFFPGNKALMMFVLTLFSWCMVLLAARVIRATVLSGPSAPFVLELPPYRVPTLRGLLIHAWERTWMYVRKAGTTILIISLTLWALMTFPSLPDEQARSFDQGIERARAEFLANPAVKDVFKSEEDWARFEKFRDRLKTGDANALKAENPAFFGLAKALDSPDDRSETGVGSDLVSAAAAYIERKQGLEQEKQAETLRNTVAGRAGQALVWFSWPLGFDWRTNVSLVGGFAAKEVVVATMGTAYSLGDVDPKESLPLSEKLRVEPGWGPLKAFCLIIFVMLYAPCLVTLVVIRKETGTWRWPLFAVAYTLVLAYSVTLLIRTAGTALGWS